MKTVGQTLLAERKKKKWTLDEVQKFTKIHSKFIKAIEADDYSIFEGRVHAKGFLKIYIEFLELDSNELLAIWRREHDNLITRVPFKKNKQKIKIPTKIKLPVIAFSYKTLIFLGVLGISGIFFAYIFFQYQKFSAKPILVIDSPKDNSVTNSNFINVSGIAEKQSELLINGQNVNIDENGKFETVIKLSPGQNNLNFFLKNTLGTTSTKDLKITYNSGIKVLPVLLETIETSESSQQNVKE